MNRWNSKLKRFFRKKYILHKYKYNYNSDKFIYLKPTDRQLGLTFILIKDSIEQDIPILTPSKTSKNHLAHEMFKMGQLELVKSVTESYALNKLIVTPYELRGRGNIKVLVDSSCTEYDILKMYKENNRIKVVNGFITSYFMA